MIDCGVRNSVINILWDEDDLNGDMWWYIIGVKSLELHTSTSFLYYNNFGDKGSNTWSKQKSCMSITVELNSLYCLAWIF